MPYVYCTLTADQCYAIYPSDLNPEKVPKTEREIFVSGGANVIDRRLHTPRGVATHVSAEELKLLETIPAFKKHKDKGFVKVDEKQHDPEEVAKKDMTDRDTSAQLEEKDFDPEKKPKVNKSRV